MIYRRKKSLIFCCVVRNKIVKPCFEFLIKKTLNQNHLIVSHVCTYIHTKKERKKKRVREKERKRERKIKIKM